MIAIVDYNMGNLASLQNSFDKIGIQASVEKDPDKLLSYDKVLLPGVGAFGDAMSHLRDNGMDDAIKGFVATGKPLFGICLGMQLLFEQGEEFGSHEGLGLIQGHVQRFVVNENEKLKVPQMGWNKLFTTQKSPLWKGLDESFYLYFVHSYHVVCDDSYAIGVTDYGYRYTSAVCKDNVYGLQPHPEKSHNIGLSILSNFATM